MNHVRFTGITEEEQGRILHHTRYPKDGLYDRAVVERLLNDIYGTNAFESITYHMEGHEEPYTLVFDCQKGQTNDFALGLRADTDETVAVALHYGLGTRRLAGPRMTADLKLGTNPALEIDGCFDDCQALVKAAFADAELRATQRLTSANSINVARFLPQAFYYFHAYAQLQRKGLADKVVCCVPSGNFGNLCAALFGKRMGLPVHRFIAANNANRVFYDFLQDGEYRPRASVQTLANAMDVGDPSNFARIWDLYGHDLRALRAEVSGATYTDGQIAETIRDCYARTGYVLDPHGACGYRALKEGLRPGETGFFCETAHPAKFKDSVERILGAPVAVPERLAAFMQGTRRAVPLGKDYESFRQYLLSV